MAWYRSWIAWLLWTLFVSNNRIYGDFFSALSRLESLLRIEDELGERMIQLIAEEEQRIQDLRRVADQLDNQSRQGLLDPDTYLANPLNAYLLVKALTHDWERIRKTNLKINDQFFTKSKDIIEGFPSYEDFTGASLVLFKLQNMYGVSAEDMARGRVVGIKSAPEVKAKDCLDIAHEARQINDYKLCSMWAQCGLHFLDIADYKGPVYAACMEYLVYCTQKSGDVLEAIDLNRGWLHHQPQNTNALANKEYLLQLLHATKDDLIDDLPPVPASAMLGPDRLLALCRGEAGPARAAREPLICAYKYPNPYFYLRPLKEEILSRDPWITFYHDIIVESEISAIKQTAAPLLARAMIHVGNSLKHSDNRITQSAWLSNQDHAVVQRVTDKIEGATGLTLDTAEQLQVANYGIGGFYAHHCDYFIDDIVRPDGNRIATALIYMSDVAAGGATVFLDLGLSVWPEKGGIVFWYNLLQSGQPDNRTLHAACPVLTGSKWVGNKWLRERGQEFRRPCSLNPLK